MSRPRYDALLLDTRDEHALFSKSHQHNDSSDLSEIRERYEWFVKKWDLANHLLQALPSSPVTFRLKARKSFEMRSYAEATDISLTSVCTEQRSNVNVRIKEQLDRVVALITQTYQTRQLAANDNLGWYRLAVEVGLGKTITTCIWRHKRVLPRCKTFISIIVAKKIKIIITGVLGRAVPATDATGRELVLCRILRLL